MQTFSALDMPLAGRRLVEAGAGTGKTWSLSLLVTRMVLGDITPEPGKAEESAGIEQILVLTYTRAATAELKTGIRGRLLLARRQLEKAVCEGDAEYDETLAKVLKRVPDDLAAQRLETALRRMDEAAITTIHGFCRALVQEQALEAGLPLDLEVLADETALREEVAADFWRGRFYAASPEEVALAAARWSGPAALLEAVAPTLNLADDRVLPRLAPDALDAACAAARTELAALGRMWAAEREAILVNVADEDCWKKGSPWHPDLLSATLAELAALLEGPEPRFPRPLPESLAGLTAASLTDFRKKSPKACQDWKPHAFFDVFARFWERYQAIPAAWTVGLLHEARVFIRDELARRKLERGCFGYDDMLNLAARALTHPETGPRLASALRGRYRAIFVDEFQDSDPAQYRIFDAIARAPGFPLVMIGDPKQAIYAFRGGDIFTYLRAREDCPEDGRYTMITNYRAAPAMVAAVNALFTRRDDPFLNPKISFPRARAAGLVQNGACLVDGAPLTPLNFFPLTEEGEGEIAMGQADERAATVCAGAIRRLLHLAKTGRAVMGERALSGHDIAVLAANHRQAELVRRTLSGLGIPSAYTGRVSVFTSREAAETECLLRALLNLHDRGLQAEALNTALFGLGVAELAAEGAEASRRPQDLRELAEHWRREGVGPMLHRLFRTRELVARLSRLPDGERRLTNFLHLAELLDEEEARAPGRERLLRRLERLRREAGESEAEEQLLRLESERDLVRIGTLHGAKGLEFPLVFLPFLWRSQERQGRGAITCHDAEGRALADFAAGDDHREAAGAEARAEAIRLLYVGLTRAKFANFICWGRVKGMETTPLARLLHDAPPQDEASLRHDLDTLNEAKTEPLARLLPAREPPWPEGTAKGTDPAPEEAVTLSARRFIGAIPQGLGACSFTGIVSGREPVGDMEEKGEDSPAAPVSTSSGKEGTFADIADFPRGVNPGTCLHRMLELLDFTRPAAEQGELATSQLEAHGLDTAWTPVLLPWLDGVLNTELPGSRALAGLPPGDRLSELRFHFPLRRLDFPALDRLLARFALPPLTAGAEAPPNLAERLMTGSIDLVFRHAGRYFIVDYKSNHLGPNAAAYDEAAMAEAMTRHHYHLQYLIYSTALRRHLRDRGLDPARTFGGVYYLFSRGMRPGATTGIFRAEPELELLRGFEELLGYGEGSHAG